MKLKKKRIRGEFCYRKVTLAYPSKRRHYCCLDEKLIPQKERFIKIGNAFGADPTLLCLEHGKERGYL